MNPRLLLSSIVLLAFLGMNVWVLRLYGYMEVFQLVLANPATTLAFVDLCIALGLVTIWMWQDARDRGLSALPYAVLTLAFGSVGPLLYLIRRELPRPGAAPLAAGSR